MISPFLNKLRRLAGIERRLLRSRAAEPSLLIVVRVAQERWDLGDLWPIEEVESLLLRVLLDHLVLRVSLRVGIVVG